MDPHDEFDLLSAYLDGELDAADRARLDAHMTTCADCRATLAGLRATLAELKTLPEPDPRPQDSWALRAAIRRARSSPMRRWQRFGYAAGAVAAAAIAFAAITLPDDGGKPQDLALSREAAGTAGVPLFSSSDNLTALEAQQRLLDAAGLQSGTAAAALGGGQQEKAKDSARVPGAVATEQVRAFAAYSGPESDPLRAQIDRCVAVVRSSTQVYLDPLKFEVATFEDKPAFLLYFRTTERYELWVTGRSDCAILYFGQTA